MQTYEKNGLKFIFRENTSDIKNLIEILERKEYYRKYFKINPGEKWLDLGGYIGVFGIWAASQGAEVFAYEPYPDSYNLYIENIKINNMQDKIHCFNCAVVQDYKSEEMELGINKNGNFWRNSLFHTPAKGSSVKVKCYPFEKVITLAQNVKMDVEGAEFDMLKDMSLYEHVNKLVYEHSFDCNPSIDLYREITTNLLSEFGNIRCPKYKEEHKIWPSSWFPACAKVFAWR